MALTMAPKKTRPVLIVENWLTTLSDEDRTEALTYLSDPAMYAHTDVANMVSASLGYRVTEKTVSGWRQRNL